jgi:hypothetical protein
VVEFEESLARECGVACSRLRDLRCLNLIEIPESLTAGNPLIPEAGYLVLSRVKGLRPVFVTLLSNKLCSCAEKITTQSVSFFPLRSWERGGARDAMDASKQQ